ncbi:capsid protein [uncultured Weissella sp.]|uniref:capsid protein n=1 Tax=Weissella viridescens TaxID=1629 RepID=UPI0027DBA6F1|nr:capsid protein [uncultured Weissella sp.]
MTIALDSKDLATLDQEYSADSQIWNVLAGGAKSITQADFVGAREVRVNKMGGLGSQKYKRGQDNQRSQIEMTKETQKLTQEDWFAYDVDALDMEENAGATVANIASQQLRMVTIPERDTYVAEKLIELSKAQGGDQYKTESITTKNALGSYDTAMAYMMDHEVSGGFVMFVSSDYYTKLKNADNVSRTFSSTDMNIQGINRSVGMLDGIVPIIPVSKKRLNGLTAGNDVNFILVPLLAVAPITKYSNVSAISPDTDRDGNRWTIKGLNYYDAIIFDNARESIYVSVAKTDTSNTGNSNSGETPNTSK